MAEKTNTIKFYTDSGRYIGWEYTHKETFRGIKSWLRSGNFAKIGALTLDSSTSDLKLSKLFPR